MATSWPSVGLVCASSSSKRRPRAQWPLRDSNPDARYGPRILNPLRLPFRQEAVRWPHWYRDRATSDCVGLQSPTGRIGALDPERPSHRGRRLLAIRQGPLRVVDLGFGPPQLADEISHRVSTIGGPTLPPVERPPNLCLGSQAIREVLVDARASIARRAHHGLRTRRHGELLGRGGFAAERSLAHDLERVVHGGGFGATGPAASARLEHQRDTDADARGSRGTRPASRSALRTCRLPRGRREGGSGSE